MLVYRLENHEGAGCYSCGMGHKCSRQRLEDNDPTLKDLHPSPQYDPKLQKFWGGFHLKLSEMTKWPNGDRNLWLCAFASLEQLEAWFPVAGLEKMIRLNQHFQDTMQLVVYKVPHHKVRKGETQVVFHRSFANPVGHMSLQDLVDKLVTRAIT